MCPLPYRWLSNVAIDENYVNISTAGTNDFKVACYKQQNCNHNVFYNYDDSYALNWGFAIGESLGGMTGKVRKNGNQYTMFFKYYLIDTYEFASHYDSTPSWIDINGHIIHEAGFAKEFKVLGCYSGAVTWEKGDIFMKDDYAEINLEVSGYDN